MINHAPLHLMASQGDRRPYCGYRGKSSTTNARPMVTCSACIAAYNADVSITAQEIKAGQVWRRKRDVAALKPEEQWPEQGGEGDE